MFSLNYLRLIIVRVDAIRTAGVAEKGAVIISQVAWRREVWRKKESRQELLPA